MCVSRRWPDLRHLGAGAAPVAKIWRSPLAKADTDYEWLHVIADAAEPKVRDAFLQAVEDVRGTPKEAALREALATGSVDRVMAVLNIQGAMETALAAKVLPVLEDVFIAAGRAAPEATIPSQLLGGAVSYRFDISNPETLAYLRSYSGEMIREISEETRLAVRQVVADAFAYGGHPREQARTIRTLVGLTRRGAKAVASYESALREEQRPEDQIARMVEKYRQKMLKLRATAIARTETINAASAGQRAAWEGAANKGLLNRVTVRIGWGVTDDDALCEICAAIPDMNEEGVRLGGDFATPVGPKKGPTAHPLCRCYLFIMAF